VCGFYVLPTVAKKPMRPEMLSLIEEGARIQRDPRKFARPFKRIIRNDVSEFESHMPSHAVGLWASSRQVAESPVFKVMRKVEQSVSGAVANPPAQSASGGLAGTIKGQLR
jgi:hypothetical protein